MTCHHEPRRSAARRRGTRRRTPRSGSASVGATSPCCPDPPRPRRPAAHRRAAPCPARDAARLARPPQTPSPRGACARQSLACAPRARASRARPNDGRAWTPRARSGGGRRRPRSPRQTTRPGAPAAKARGRLPGVTRARARARARRRPAHRHRPRLPRAPRARTARQTWRAARPPLRARSHVLKVGVGSNAIPLPDDGQHVGQHATDHDRKPSKRPTGCSICPRT